MSAGFLISGVDASPRENLPRWPFVTLATCRNHAVLQEIPGLTTALSVATLAHASEGEGVAPAAAKLVDFGNGWAITNSMATGWVDLALS